MAALLFVSQSGVRIAGLKFQKVGLIVSLEPVEAAEMPAELSRETCRVSQSGGRRSVSRRTKMRFLFWSKMEITGREGSFNVAFTASCRTSML